MKQIRILYIAGTWAMGCLLSTGLKAQTVVQTSQAGTLSTLIEHPLAVTRLVVSGPLNEADYYWLRENCPNIKSLDLSGVTTSTIPAQALSRKIAEGTASSKTDFSLTLNGTVPRYTKEGVQVIFLDKKADITAATVTYTLADGATVTPDPRTVTFTDGSVQSFYVTAEDGTKAQYDFVATLDDWFAMVVGSDPEIGKENMATSVGTVSPTLESVKPHFEAIAAICGKESDDYTFDDYSFIKPKVEIVFSLGDLDADRNDHTNIKKCFDVITATGTPMIAVFGNHDWDPEVWGDGSPGFGFDGNTINNMTVSTVKSYVSTSSGSSMTTPITDVKYYTASNGATQPSPFSFRFRNVQFFMAGNYWFQPPYTYWGVTNPSFYAPDDIINGLESYIDNTYNKEEPAVWMQHFPLIHGSDIGRWWTNQDANWTSPEVPTEASAPYSYKLDTKWTGYSAKLEAYKSLIRKTKNPQHFSGHFHYYNTDVIGDALPIFTDYICGYQGVGQHYLVLVRESIGVVAVKQVTF
jgi:hypothetical protein